MSLAKGDSPDGRSEMGESYLHSGSDIATEHFSTRSSTIQAGFLLPHLRSGMRLLDCGCGPGVITLGLAKSVSSGQVVGIDVDDTQVELARVAALRENVTNVRFETASVYELPFSDATFDGLYSNGVLSHLSDPLAALQEMYRVLKPNGIVGIRHADAGGQLIAPLEPLLTQTWSDYWRLIEHNGGHRYVGRQQQALLRQAGFMVVNAGASCETYSSQEATRYWGRAIASGLQDELADRLIELGWADSETLNQMIDAWREWGENPDAFYTEVWCEAVGRAVHS